MTNWDDTVRAVARLAGIELSYRNALGRTVETPIGSIRAVLSAMSIDTDSEWSASDSHLTLQRREQGLASRIVVAAPGKPPRIALHERHSGEVIWRLEGEDGRTSEGRANLSGNEITLPTLPAGYHNAFIRLGSETASVTIMVAPQLCWRPPPGPKRWGLSGALYGLASANDTGIGDFTDLSAIAAMAGERGASFFGVNPLHALFSADRSRISPYSPSSRLFLDPVYIDPRLVHGYDRSTDDRTAVHSEAERRPGPGEELVDYDRVWSEVRPILHALWVGFRRAGGSDAFDRFTAERGVALAQHAAFEAYADIAHGSGKEPYRDLPTADSAEMVVFNAEHGGTIEFHAWVQWLADGQLGAAAANARKGGMDIGLLTDLAVGADPQGSEVWATPERYLTGLTIGAPPDELAPYGQNWALRALDPLEMQRNQLAGFRELVSANMRHAGGIRIDHAFQFRRLFLIPNGATASDGAYVTYPTEAILAALRIESHRAQCMVIGEDLGTSPPNFSETLSSSGILGYRVLYFERMPNGDFQPPHSYDREAMAVINTHDLASLNGWWAGRDIEERLQFGVVDRAGAEIARQERDVDRHRLMRLLRSQGLTAQSDLPTEVPILAVARLLARCSSELVGLQLDDVIGSATQQNIPGVTEGAPNWRNRLPATIKDLASAGGPLDRFGRAMAAEGRRSHPNLLRN